MSPTIRRWSGRSTKSSTSRSSSRMATRVSRGVPLIRISRFTRIVSRASARGAVGLPNVKGRPPALERPVTAPDSIDRQWRRPSPVGDGAGAERRHVPHLQPAALPSEGTAHLHTSLPATRHLRPTSRPLAHGAREGASAHQEAGVSSLRRGHLLHIGPVNVRVYYTYV